MDPLFIVTLDDIIGLIFIGVLLIIAGIWLAYLGIICISDKIKEKIRQAKRSKGGQ